MNHGTILEQTNLLVLKIHLRDNVSPLLNAERDTRAYFNRTAIQSMSHTQIPTPEVKTLGNTMLVEGKGTELIGDRVVEGDLVVTLLTRITWINDPPIFAWSENPRLQPRTASPLTMSDGKEIGLVCIGI